MDKRWIGIIIILLVGLSAMFLIVESSTTVGHALAVSGDLSITIPQGFKVGETGATHVSMYNQDDNIIFVDYLQKGNKSLEYYENNLTDLKNNPDITILGNSSNGTTYTIKYINPNSKYKTHNETLVFFVAEGRTLSMKLVQYDNFKNQDEHIKFIIDNIKHDYKQNKGTDEFKEFTI